MESRGDIGYPVGEIHEVRQRVLVRRHIIWHGVELERRSSVAQFGVSEVHRTRQYPADVLIRHVLGHAGIVRFGDRRGAVVGVEHHIPQAGLVAALDIAHALRDSLSGYPVLSRIEAGGIHRALGEGRVLLHHDLYDMPAAQRYHGVVELPVLKPRHAVLGELTPAEVAPVDKDINGSVVITPREHLTVRLLGVVRNPMVAEVVAVGVVKHLYDVVADV